MYVSIHAHVRWATPHHARHPDLDYRFNPRPRTVGDTFGRPTPGAGESFNPRPRTVGDKASSVGFLGLIMFQSTPTYGGRQLLPPDQFPPEKVSIHAHVRWATPAGAVNASDSPGFNPRPRTVGDGDWGAYIPMYDWFQSTPTYGGRPPASSESSFACRVSIHAHVRWATNISSILPVRRTSFNPRPRTVGDLAPGGRVAFVEMFQSTPTYGGRLDGAQYLFDVNGFQSTPTYGGRRFASAGRKRAGEGFNPRPRTVGDAVKRSAFIRWVLFQSTPTYGGRLCLPNTLKDKERIVLMRESAI